MLRLNGELTLEAGDLQQSPFIFLYLVKQILKFYIKIICLINDVRDPMHVEENFGILCLCRARKRDEMYENILQIKSTKDLRKTKIFHDPGVANTL